jgi:hypothetical protein
MKANEFVKKFGWLRAKQILNYADKDHISFLADGISTTYSHYDKNMISLDDLKRLVESYELVESYGGYDLAKEVKNITPLRKKSYDLIEKLKQAIADVESCL